MRSVVRIVMGLSLAVVLASLAPPAAGAEDLRHGNRLGVSVGLIADPVPSIISTEISYDLAPSWRVHGSLGGGIAPGFLGAASWASYGAGVRFLALPQKPISPFVGASATYSSIEYDMLWVSTTESTWTGVATAGFDWQTRAGFNLALGGSVLLKPSDSPFKPTVLPNLRLGWLF